MTHQEKLNTLIGELGQLAKSSDEAARNNTIDAIRALVLTIETKQEVYSRFEQMGVELSLSRIAQDLNLYTIFSNSQEPIKSAGLADQVGAAPLLMRRILRFLASFGQLEEVGVDTFTANNLTKILADPGYRGHIYHTFDNVLPVFQALPEFLAETKYQDIKSAANTAAQKAFATQLPMFAWLPSQPKRFEPLQQAMTIQPRGEPWFTVFPFKEQLGDVSGEIVLVDVGGGFGHQCLQLIGAYPDLKDKLVLQDLEQTLAHLPPLDGIKTQAHDFFNPQPVRDAKFYYLRQVLHDWPDKACLDILVQIKKAMGSDSQLLIDEIVVPDAGAHHQVTTIDMIMMSSLGSLERTVNDWTHLLTEAGFRILRIDTHQARRQNSIIQAVVA